jgi:hypothetical protein
MEIRWSTKMVDDLVDIVTYLKRNKMGEILEVLGDYFIKKHAKKMQIDKYTMDFDDSIDADKIMDGEYKLAFICELVNSYANKKRKFRSFSKKIKKKKLYKDKKIFNNNVFYCIAFLIKYCISHILKFSSNKIDYRIFFLISVIKEKILPEYVIQNKEDTTLDVLNISYYLTSEMVSLSENKPEIIYQNTSLLSNSENLDISICTNKQIREICSVLNTKRTIFARILLVLAFEISKIKNILDPLWIEKATRIENYNDFISLFNSPLIETMIFLTSQRIKIHEELEELNKIL